jgi:hypothetical protein
VKAHFKKRDDCDEEEILILPFHFDKPAQDLFRQWFEELEKKIDEEEGDALNFSNFRKEIRKHVKEEMRKNFKDKWKDDGVVLTGTSTTFTILRYSAQLTRA